MKLLTSVFSYNRYSYLKNFIDSWQEFFSHGDLLVVDDGSDDPDLVMYLQTLKSESNIEVVQVGKKSVDGYMHGGLYHNMDLACEYAIKKGYTYLYLAQDDNQFIWHDSSFIEIVDDYFSRLPKLAMIQNRFVKAVWREAGRLESKVTIVDGGSCYHLTGNSMLDVGVVKLDLIRQYNFKFALGNEQSNGAWWRERNYFAILLKSPSMCFVPEPTVFRDRKKSRAKVISKQRYYIKPLDKLKVDSLVGRSIEDRPVRDDWCEPWGWKCKKPYFERSDETYYKQVFKRIYRQRLARHVEIFSALIPMSLRARMILLLRD